MVSSRNRNETRRARPVYLRPLLVILIILLVPLLPYLFFHQSLQAWYEGWIARRPSSDAISLMIVLLLAGDLLLPVPSSLISTLAGGTLSLLRAIAASWTGMTVGALIGFGFMRILGRRASLRKWMSRDVQQIESLCQRYGAYAVLLTRPLPILAEACVLLLGLYGTRWTSFVVALSLGNLVLALVYSALGNLAAENEWLPIAMCVSVVLPFALTQWIIRRLRGRADK